MLSTFQKPTYKKVAAHPDGKNSINFRHFPNAKKEKTKYKAFGQPNPERDQLAKEGKCSLCKKLGYVARDYLTRKVSFSYQKVNKRSIYNVKTASLSVESHLDTSHLHVMRPPTDNRTVITLDSQKILNAVEISINGHKVHAFIDSCSINGDL